MKTDDLITVLATFRPPAPSAWQLRLLNISLGFALAIAVAVMAMTLGVRPGIMEALAEPAVLAKIIFVSSLVGLSLIAFEGEARPVPARRRPWLIMLPFAAMAALAVATLAAAPFGLWGEIVRGGNWLVCLVSVPALALPAAIILILVGRQRAATDLPRAGWSLGFLAGAVGAFAYALHCPDDAAPFVLVWYGAGVGLCSLIGRSMASVVLRW